MQNLPVPAAPVQNSYRQPMPSASSTSQPQSQPVASAQASSQLSAELTRLHPLWKSFIAALSSPSAATQRSALLSLHQLSQQSTQHCFHLLSLQVLNSLLPFFSSRYPDQSMSELCMSLLANLCWEQWTAPKQQEYLLSHLHRAVYAVLCAPVERAEPLRVQAYRCMWNLLNLNKKAKADKEVMTDAANGHRFLTVLAKDATGRSEAVRQMCAGLVWAVADSRLFSGQFLAIKGVDYVLHALEPNFSNSPDSLYLLLSALHVLCTDPAVKKRIQAKNGLQLLLRTLREHPSATQSSLVVGRLGDAIGSLTFSHREEQQKAARSGAVQALTRYLTLACRRSPLQAAGGRLYSMEKAMPRLCIALIAICFRNPLLQVPAEAAALMPDLETAVVALVNYIMSAPLSNLPVNFAPALTVCLLASQSQPLQQRLIDMKAVPVLLTFLSPPPAASADERKRMLQIGLFMLLPLLTPPSLMQQHLLSLSFTSTLISLLHPQHNALLPYTLRLLCLFLYRNEKAARQVVTHEEGMLRRHVWQVMIKSAAGGASGAQLCVWAAGALYSMMGRESLGNDSGMLKLVADVAANPEAQKAIRIIDSGADKWREQMALQQQQQPQSTQQQQQPQQLQPHQQLQQQLQPQPPPPSSSTQQQHRGGGFSSSDGSGLLASVTPGGDELFQFLNELVEMEEGPGMLV